MTDAAATARSSRLSLARRLRAAGVDSPDSDARVLVEGALGLERWQPDASVDAGALARLDGFAARRLAGEPVWRILGEREFWGLRFRLSSATLEPRPDSEAIVEAALQALGPRRQGPLSVLDLGTGTGCLLISVLHECAGASGLGIDLSAEACETARGNAALNGVAGRATFRQGDWTAGLSGPFDLVLSNPPYIASGEIAGLAVEVREHDPRLALDGGADGLDCYRLLARQVPPLLFPGGLVVLEIGAGQEHDVQALMMAGGLAFRGSRYDLGGHIRALIFESA